MSSTTITGLPAAATLNGSELEWSRIAPPRRLALVGSSCGGASIVPV